MIILIATELAILIIVVCISIYTLHRLIGIAAAMAAHQCKTLDAIAADIRILRETEERESRERSMRGALLTSHEGREMLRQRLAERFRRAGGVR